MQIDPTQGGQLWRWTNPKMVFIRRKEWTTSERKLNLIRQDNNLFVRMGLHDSFPSSVKEC